MTNGSTLKPGIGLQQRPATEASPLCIHSQPPTQPPPTNPIIGWTFVIGFFVRPSKSHRFPGKSIHKILVFAVSFCKIYTRRCVYLAAVWRRISSDLLGVLGCIMMPWLNILALSLGLSTWYSSFLPCLFVKIAVPEQGLSITGSNKHFHFFIWSYTHSCIFRTTTNLVLFRIWRFGYLINVEMGYGTDWLMLRLLLIVAQQGKIVH